MGLIHISMGSLRTMHYKMRTIIEIPLKVKLEAPVKQPFKKDLLSNLDDGVFFRPRGRRSLVLLSDRAVDAVGAVQPQRPVELVRAGKRPRLGTIVVFKLRTPLHLGIVDQRSSD